MIIGAHTLLFTNNPDSDREFFRDVLELPNVDAGGGFLIFGLPPSEVAVHEAESGGTHELYLMCDDIESFVRSMREREVPVTDPDDQGWGVVTMLTLPGGGRLGVYEPRHPRPELPAPAARPRKRTAKKKKVSKANARPVSKKAAKKKAAKKKKKR